MFLNRTRTMALSNLMLIALLSLSSCATSTAPSHEGQTEANESPNGVVELTTKQFESSKMKLGQMELKQFHGIVKANGMFDVPPQNRVSVSSYFGGSVKEIGLLPGEPVKAGQLLFILENPDYVLLQENYLEAKGQLIYLQADYERQKNLRADNVSSQKNFLKAESDYIVTKVKLEALKKKLELMKIDPNSLTIDNIRTTIRITSPIDGYVTTVNITRGMFLNPSQVALNIVDTDHLHLELNIFERDLPDVKIGQIIRFKIQEHQTKEYFATVHLVNKTVNPVTRTIGIHGHLLDEDINDQFTPGMHVEAEIYTSTSEKIALPETAIVASEGRNFVLELVNQSENGYSFQKKEVLVGDSNEGYVEIKNAGEFAKDATFLVNGAFNLITE